MKNLRTVTAILLIAALLISGAYATGNTKTSDLETLEQEIKTLEALLEAKYDNYFELLGDDEKTFDEEFETCDFGDDFTFADELDFLKDLGVDESQIQNFEKAFNEAIAAEESEDYDLADRKWLAYDALFDEYYTDEAFEDRYSFADELEFLTELDLDETTLSFLEDVFNKALNAENADEANTLWDTYYEALEEHYDFGYNIDNEVDTFESLLEEMSEEGLELSAEDQEVLKGLFDQAMENDEWDAFDEKLYELTGWEDETSITLSAVYNVKDGKLVLSVDENDYPQGESPKDLSQTLRTLHQKMWARANVLIPKDYLKFFNKLEVGTDGEEGIMASVVELDDLSKWALFLDTKDSITENDFTRDFDFTVIHEFGHVLTLNNTQLSEEKQQNTYSTMEGHSYEKSYINAFYQIFWKGQDTSEEGAEDRYDENPNHFVSDYAATNVEEDMAESFATFMTEDKRLGKTKADQKVNFFYNYPELLKMREEIKAVL